MHEYHFNMEGCKILADGGTAEYQKNLSLRTKAMSSRERNVAVQRVCLSGLRLGHGDRFE